MFRGSSQNPLALYHQNSRKQTPPLVLLPPPPPPSPKTPPIPSAPPATSSSTPPPPPLFPVSPKKKKKRERKPPQCPYKNLPEESIESIKLVFVLEPVSMWFRMLNHWPYTDYPTDVFLEFKTAKLATRVSFKKQCAYRLPDAAKTVSYSLYTLKKHLYPELLRCVKTMNDETMLVNPDESPKRWCQWRVSDFMIPEPLVIYEPHQFIVNALNEFYKIDTKNQHEILFDITRTLTLVEFFQVAQNILAPTLV